MNQLPPCNHDAELAVLGSMILDAQNECRPDIACLLTPEDFYHQTHQVVFQAELAIYDTGAGLDLALLAEELKKQGNFQTIGGAKFLSDILDATPSAANGTYYARIVKEKSLLRTIISATEQIKSEAFQSSAKLKDIMDLIESELLNVQDVDASQTDCLIGDIIDGVVDQICDTTKRDGLPTGFYELDDLLGGLHKGEMIVIAGRPSMGKSTLGMNIAENAALLGHSVAFFSLEMNRQSLVTRTLSGRSQIDSTQIRRGYLTVQDKDSLRAVSNELRACKLVLDDSPSLTPMQLRAKARRYQQKYGVELVVVDYLQLMKAPKQKDRFQEVGYISSSLKQLARELDIPVIAMSQLNRQAEQRTDKRPKLADLRESGNIEQDADVVILLHREDFYKKNDPDYQPTNLADIEIAKQRNGAQGTVHLVWDGPHTIFHNLTRGAN